MKPAPSTLHSRLLVACVGIAAAGFSGRAAAQGAWLPTTWFSRESIDPKAMFPLAESDGPWLVLATTFRGEGAREDARRLVHELRGAHRLQAYTHEKAFDYRGDQQGLGLKPDGSPKRMRYAKSEQVVEVAVLVGDFASFDDPRAQKTLAKIKSLQPDSLSGGSGRSQSFSDFRRVVGLDRTAGKGPMHLAFVIPNPLLPEDFFTRQEVDSFVLEMNADVSHSLLDCPGRYSVRVATFTGAGTFDQKAIESGADAQLESRLVEAAEQAHRLTESLRRSGWQAWEFHDRESSMVCVGSLDQLAVPQAGGAMGVNPEITRIVAALGPDPARLAAGVVMPRVIDGILLDVQPKPIDVPRVPSGRRR
ncbi:MAG: hypothetical protein EBZ59_00370 [Planctomycetia bacterium]|nr:hypothetical protein [Planctomycetia bacterium]